MANVPAALSSVSGLPSSITAGVTTGEVADTLTTYNAVKAILAEWPKITAFEYHVDKYGAGTAMSGAANSTAINAAITAANAAGGGVVKFGPGTYNVTDPAPASGFGSAAISMKRNVVLRGEGMWSTTLKITNDGGLVYHLSSTDTINPDEYEGVEDMTLWGYGDRNPTQGGDGTRNLFIRADMCWATRVRSIYARQMGLTLDANGPRGCLVNECRVEKTYRDAINATGSTRATIIDNYISEAADDAIAYHVASGLALGTIVSQQAVVIGNRMEKTFGIKLLGASNATITGNSGRFLYGYGVQVAYDATFNEGNKDMLGVVIANNTFMDILNQNVVDAAHFGNLGCGIYLHSPPPDPGTGPTGIAYTPGVVTAGTGTASVGTNQSTANHWNTLGPPSTGSWATVVANNTLMQTLSGGTNFSDYGFGLIWTQSGSVDITFPGNIGIKYATATVENMGIALRQGALRDVLITGNKMVGFTEGVGALNWPVMPRLTVKQNSFVRVNRGVSLLGGSGGSPKIQALIDGNEFDMDPLFEATTRVQATPGNNATFTGAWNITDGGLSSSCVWSDQIEGITFSNNHVRNAGRVYTDNLDLVILDGNVIYTDPTVTPEDPTSWLGVPVPNDPVLRSSRIVSTVSDPRLATYNQIRATAKRSDRPLVQRKSADQAMTGTTLAAITGLYFIAEASTDYTIDAVLVFSASSTSTALPKIEVQGLQFGGSALPAPTLLHLVRDSQTSVTAWAANTITAYVTGTGGTTSAVGVINTNYQIRLRGIFRNSGTRGFFRIVGAPSGAGTLTIRAGSTLTVS